MKNQLYPIFLKLNQFDILIVGGGSIGLEKLQSVIKNSPKTKITIVSKTFNPKILFIAANHKNIKIEQRAFAQSDLNNKDLVIVATDNAKLNGKIKAKASKKRILANVADSPALCDFYLGSIVQKGDLKVAVSTNGSSPILARRLREFFEQVIPDDITKSIGNLKKIRGKISGGLSRKVKILNSITEVLEEEKENKEESIIQKRSEEFPAINIEYGLN